MYPANRSRSRTFLYCLKVWICLTMSGVIIFSLILLTRQPDYDSLLLRHTETLRLDNIPTTENMGTNTKLQDNIHENLAVGTNPTDDFLTRENLAADDPQVIKRLINNFLVPPPEGKQKQKYNLDNPRLKDTSMGQAEQIRKALHNKTNGFFIECGALDGETRSNTLYMERFLGWQGLLIEADPLNFAKMVKKHRRAWLSPTCLSKSPHPQLVSFKQDFNIGRISDLKAGEKRAGHVDVHCFPFYSYLLAMNITHVDYFSLDVEGDELAVLKTIPWDKVDIDTLSVEFVHVDDGKDTIREFMTSKGYVVAAEVTHPDWLANDFIFVKKSLST